MKEIKDSIFIDKEEMLNLEIKLNDIEKDNLEKTLAFKAAELKCHQLDAHIKELRVNTS